MRWGCRKIKQPSHKKDVPKACLLRRAFETPSFLFLTLFLICDSHRSGCLPCRKSCRRTGRKSGTRRSRPFLRYSVKSVCSKSECVSSSSPSYFKFRGILFSTQSYGDGFPATKKVSVNPSGYCTESRCFKFRGIPFSTQSMEMNIRPR